MRMRPRAALAVLVLAAVSLILTGRDARAIPFFHVAGDADGDHLVATDPNPAVYCGAGHADNNSDGVVTAADLAFLGATFGTYPLAPAVALRDQNHDDAGDIMDVALTFRYFASNLAVACASPVASPLPINGVGATVGAPIELSQVGAPGLITVTASTLAPSAPYLGYWVKVTFDPMAVTATGAANLSPVPGGCLGPFISNVPDVNGFGSIAFGCENTLAAVAVAGPLANFTFTPLVAVGEPLFRIYPYTAPYGGGPPLTAGSLDGTYTIGADYAPQIQDVRLDSDGDGCRDSRETGANQLTGGLRNPLLRWDFFDVPNPALSINPAAPRNKVISIADAIAALAYIGTFVGGPPNGNGANYNTDLNLNLWLDGEEYDRTPSIFAGQPWRVGPPNGAVTIGDALLLLNSIGHNCS